MERIYWNEGWDFVEDFKGDDIGAQEWSEAVPVRLPHTTREVPLHYFDESLYQMVCGYRRVFNCDPEWKGKKVLMTLEAAGHSAWVYLNGELLAEHHNGYTAFTVDLTDNLVFSAQNRLVIKVSSMEDQNIPPFGNVIDYMTFGGLYREVYIDIKDVNYIEDVVVRTSRLRNGQHDVEVSADIVGTDYDKENLEVRHIITDATDDDLRMKKGGFGYSIFRGVWNEWSPNHPRLYHVKTELYRGEELIDCKETTFGVREAEFKADGFYLNGVKLTIRGLNRHQSYPYVGYAMPESMQKFDADILKNELGVNAVRTSHYPQSHHFLDRCDEIGLLVFTEIPGWQYVGDDEWKEQAVKNTEEMVMQYRNHPSIILWGTRINESQDCDELYVRTNRTAKELDNTRQTSGVRFIQKSHLIEDVYAYNDFSHDGTTKGCTPKKATTPDMSKGFLISEYNGHMFPTKPYDTEEHRVEHMLRHARVMDAYYGEAGIAGGFGWCMFDYNTHKDFGSGDRVCYHGVTDLFRNPKMAAALYKSQNCKEPVMEISSAMEVGEHPACLLQDVYVITNVDSVRFYKNDRLIGEFGEKKRVFKNLPHSPILIDDLIGNLMEVEEGFDHGKSEDVKKVLMAAAKYGIANLPVSAKALAAKCMTIHRMTMEDAVELYNKYIGNWGGTATVYKFEAIKDGEVVKTVIKKPMTEAHIEAEASHTELVEGHTYDVAAVRIKAVSDSGNVIDFCNDPIAISATGDIEVIGPDLVSFMAGRTGCYVRTLGREGSGTLTLDAGQYGKTTIQFTITKQN